MKMTLITYSPKRNTISNIDRWFGDLLDIDCQSVENQIFQPEFNITEGNSSYHISTDLPGMNKKDVNISISDGMISISGERKISKPQKTSVPRYRQIRCGKFERSFYIPEDVNIDKINAKMNDGVLSIEIEKSKKVSTNIKKISIK